VLSAVVLAEVVLDLHKWTPIARESGPVNYYTVIDDPKRPYIRAAYAPKLETAVLGYELSDDARDRARKLRWSWRVMAFPRSGDNCDKNPDAAATVYVTWKRGLRYYTVKYLWATAVPKGTVCHDKRNAFVAQDAVVLESGGPPGVWASEEIDLRQEFRRHFEDGDPEADVPGWLGVAIMSDGDQTASYAAADFAGFVLRP
jgi:DUF3047 family protein